MLALGLESIVPVIDFLSAPDAFQRGSQERSLLPFSASVNMLDICDANFSGGLSDRKIV